MDFGLMIAFIGHFDTASDYALHFTIAHTHTHTVHSHVYIAVAWQWLLTADVALSLGFRTIPGLSYQLLTFSLTRGRVCCLQLLQVLASAVILIF
jgi:hypothetical protein